MARTPFAAKLALAYSLSFTAFISAAEKPHDDLLSVVQETLDTNPELQIRLHAFQASTYDQREAFGGYLPSIDVSASGGIGARDYDDRGSYNRNYAEVSLTQMLFDGFRVRNAVARAEHSSRARYYELLDEAETKALEASEVYLSVLRHRELVALAQQNVANHQRVQRHVSDRVGRGISNRADLQQIDGRLSLARSNLMTEVANLQSVTARFQRLVGRFPAENLTPFEVEAQAVPEGLWQVLKTVYANNPALFAAFEEIQASEASYGEAKSGRYPTLELGARHGTYKNNNSFDTRSDPHSYGDETVIELRARYNLYRGGSDRAAERAANRRISQAESMRDKTCVDLRQTATIAHSDVLNLQVKLASLANHREEAGGVLAAYREQFDIGRRSLLDVLDSENEFFQAERAYINGTYDLEINRLQTLHSMGRLLDTLAVGSEELPDLGDINQSVNPGSSRYCTLPDDGAVSFDRYLQTADTEEVLNLGSDTLFDIGSAEFKPEAMARLQQFARRLLERGTAKSINIVGHTDSTGTDALNRELSLARAIAVRDALVDSGVTDTVMLVSGVGAYQPNASNDTAEGRALNRRVEVRVTHARK
ncbi:TolC family outer membrane protein [Marinobacter sp. 1_MG-2023]|uniref:TolC family outer membrane protein n=1 Tax=Marinobacter sp. 1_MG-2023 TaxID=3062627 RepID=UPI0026E146C3|nr:TolC family outer membrane protein [Marinobacter sp. 1_MG-2023]MDO6823562.1 TolC family outer membrane protein [Marinobacter sp. 1_MG-2023]